MSSTLILNVDDYAPGRYSRSRVLAQAGFHVKEAATGREALELMAEKPGLVLLDVNLPDMSGLEVARRIKENPETAGVIVMHLSASSLQPQQQVAGLNSGADSYLTEPIEPEVLVASIRAMLRVRAAEEALRKSIDSLRDLTYMMSHELREPLRSVTSYVQLLERRLNPTLGPDEREFMAHIVNGAKRMRDFIDSVMVYSRTAHGEQEVEDVSAETVLVNSLNDLELLVRESGAEITYSPLPMVRADAIGLGNIFSNLISNSIKYRGPERPRITISAKPQGHHYLFAFKDNGIGVEPEFRGKIFEVFKRLHGSEIPGVGIGLALCKKIVENLGGSIWVESQPGAGSTFYFTLPRAVARNSAVM